MSLLVFIFNSRIIYVTDSFYSIFVTFNSQGPRFYLYSCELSLVSWDPIIFVLITSSTLCFNTGDIKIFIYSRAILILMIIRLYQLFSSFHLRFLSGRLEPICANRIDTTRKLQTEWEDEGTETKDPEDRMIVKQFTVHGHRLAVHGVDGHGGVSLLNG